MRDAVEVCEFLMRRQNESVGERVTGTGRTRRTDTIVILYILFHSMF